MENREEPSVFAARPRSEWVASNQLAFAIRDAFPVTAGHTLVVPHRVVPTWFEAKPEERLAILELKSARGWSKVQTAERFLLRPATIAEWMKRVDEGGENALVQTHGPINRFPDFVRHIVCRLKVLCPTMGKKRIAQTRARAGLELGVSTVGRMLKERDKERPEPEAGAIGRMATLVWWTGYGKHSAHVVWGPAGLPFLLGRFSSDRPLIV